MLLTANRRFAFSASRRLAQDGWSDAENERVWGAGGEREWGSGENYSAHLVLTGSLDPVIGMLVNLTAAKAAFSPVIDGELDHKFLNLDTPGFDRTPPTPENVAGYLLQRALQVGRDLGAPVVAMHLQESELTGATAFADGRTEREWWVDFSAARVTRSPHLSEAENEALFGRAASPLGHGHGYRLRVTLAGPVDAATGLIASHRKVADRLGELYRMLDHRNLNQEVAALAHLPVTTENIARFVFDFLRPGLPVARVRLYEMPHFFAEYDGHRGYLGLERSFSAAHCLRVRTLSDEENQRVYGKCSNPNGHGHRYTVQATLAAPIDERSGTVFGLDRFADGLERVLAGLDHRHLDHEVEAFRDRPSTGENIALVLWPLLAAALDERLVRLRIFETENNRFTLRAEKEGD